MNIAGVKIDELNEKEAINRIFGYIQSSAQCHVVSVNPEGVLHAQKNAKYNKVLDNAALALTDGFGIVIAAIVFPKTFNVQKSNLKITRVTGVDLMYALCKVAAQRVWRVFLVGGEGGTARVAAENLRTMLPGLIIEGEEGIPRGFTNDQSQITNIALIKRINDFAPHLLFVALGQPRQELWIDEHLREMPSVRVAMGVGGAFDFIAGSVERAPVMLRKIGLEWLWRLMLQPSRLPRIFNATIRFAALVVSERFKR